MKFVPIKLTKPIAMAVLQAKKSSPTTMFVAGIAGVAVSTVLACRATLKLEDILDETANKLDQVKELQHKDYSEQDRVKDKTYLVVRSAVGIAKLYGPSLIIGCASIGLLTGSHRALTKQNAGLVAAYAALEKGFNEYRGRVLADVGPEKEREYRYEMTDAVMEDEKTGKLKTTRVINGLSPYAQLFDRSNRNWVNTPEYNIFFLRSQQTYANDRLRSRGHLFLNEVYDSIGLDHTPAGAVTGWVWNSNGDNYVDFGMFDTSDPETVFDFVKGREDAIWLDFNVDGVIYDKI